MKFKKNGGQLRFNFQLHRIGVASERFRFWSYFSMAFIRVCPCFVRALPKTFFFALLDQFFCQKNAALTLFAQFFEIILLFDRILWIKQSYAFSRYFDYSCSLHSFGTYYDGATCIYDYCHVLIKQNVKICDFGHWNLSLEMKNENNKTWWICSMCIDLWAQSHVFVFVFCVCVSVCAYTYYTFSHFYCYLRRLSFFAHHISNTNAYTHASARDARYLPRILPTFLAYTVSNDSARRLFQVNCCV